MTRRATAVDGDVEKLPHRGRARKWSTCAISASSAYNHCPVHSAASVGGGLPAADAAGARGRGATQRREPSRSDAGQHRPRRASRQSAGAAVQLDERAGGAPRVHAVDRPGFIASAACRGSTGRRSRRGSARGARPHTIARGGTTAPPRGDRPGAQGRVVRHLLGGVQRAGDRPRRRGRAGAQRRGRRAARAALLRHAVPRRRRDRPVSGARPRQRADAGRRGARGPRHRHSRPHLQLHAEAGIRVAGRLGGRQAGGLAHAGPVRVPGGLQAAGALDTRFERRSGR